MSPFTPRKTVGSAVLFVLFTVLTLGLLLGRPAPAFASCGGTTPFNNETQLNAAIVSFNGQGAGCIFTIQQGADFTLTADTTHILNAGAGTELHIDGNGFTIDAANFLAFHMDDTKAVADSLTIDSPFIGVEAVESDLTLTNSTFNTPDFTAVRVISSVAVLENVSMLSNGQSGSGLVINDSRVEATDILIDDMSSDGIDVFDASNLSLNRATISDGNNVGIDALDSIVHVRDSTINNNASGALANFSQLSIINSTIAFNTFAGVLVQHSKATIINSTINDNEDGLTILSFDSDPTTADIHNTIIAENSDVDCEVLVFGQGSITTTFFNSLMEDTGATACGLAAGNPDANGNIVGETAYLGELGNYGGTTQTVPLLTISGGFTATSPALNAGDTALALDELNAPLAFDQRGTGFQRVVGPSVDMGAFEGTVSLVCPAFPATVVNETEWNTAIYCYNHFTTPGVYTINFGADIALTASSTTIDNSTAGVSLIVEGDDRILDGQDIVDVRPLKVEDDTIVTINDLTITGGNMFFLDPDEGGGIYNEGTMTLNRVNVVGNATDEDGGGVSNQENATMIIVDSSISNNQAGPDDEGDGGGIENEGTMTITRSSVSNNLAINDEGSVSGGGIYNTGTLTILSSTIANNTASSNGGGSNGGGIDSDTGLTIIDSTISGNSIIDASVTSTFNEGGGINLEINPGQAIEDGEPTDTIIVNSTISGNSVSAGDFAYGGGIYFEAGYDFDLVLTIINSTIYDNEVATTSGNPVTSQAGGGIYLNSFLFDEWDLFFKLHNTIVAGSQFGGVAGHDCVTSGPNIDFDLQSNLFEATGAEACGAVDGVDGNDVGVDPLLGALLNNGGLTETHLPTALSPAIDSGDNTLALDPVNPLTADQRGFIPRIFNVIVDKGSVEVGATSPSLCPVDPNVGNLLTEAIGTGQGSATKGFRTRKLVVPNSDDVASLYGQLASVEVGVMKYVRFLPQGYPKIQIAPPTSMAHTYHAVDWWGTDLPADAGWVKGQFFWGAKGNKSPRAFVLWPTYNTAEEYANVFETFDDSFTNHVSWHTGFFPTQTQNVAIPATAAGGATINVTLALVDVDNDGRSIILTVEAGGVSEQRIITASNKKDRLNLEEFVLEGVDAGTDEVTITLESPVPSVLFPAGGDSAAMIGAAVNYACELP